MESQSPQKLKIDFWLKVEGYVWLNHPFIEYEVFSFYWRITFHNDTVCGKFNG